MELFGITFGWEAVAIVISFVVGRIFQQATDRVKAQERAIRESYRATVKRLRSSSTPRALPSPRIVSRPDLQAMTAYNEESDRNGTFERPWLASSGCELTDQIWIACERAGVDCDFVTPLEKTYADEHGFEDVRALRLFLGEEIQ